MIKYNNYIIQCKFKYFKIIYNIYFKIYILTFYHEPGCKLTM